MKDYFESIPEMISETQRELALTEQIVLELIRDLQKYPNDNAASRVRLDHCYRTLSALNGVLTDPVY
jgi:hypothetical protein